MKLDADYMQQLMVRMEESPDPIWLAPVTFDSDQKEIHHLRILCDMGYAAQINESAYRLTADGHDALAVARKGAWDNIKRMASKMSGEHAMYAIRAAIQLKIKEFIG